MDNKVMEKAALLAAVLVLGGFVAIFLAVVIKIIRWILG